MSELQKYRCYGKDELGYPYDALSMRDQFGEWYSVDEVDARLALMQRAVEYCVQHGVYWVPHWNGMCAFDWDKSCLKAAQIPEELHAIICPGSGKGE